MNKSELQEYISNLESERLSIEKMRDSLEDDKILPQNLAVRLDTIRKLIESKKFELKKLRFV